MQVQIKKTVKAGNSSAVVLPRAWLNKQVRVELVKKTPEIILNETLEILKNNIPLSEIIGIYLVGSYARKEQDENSDIDILIITKDIDKQMINQGIYSLLIVSSGLLHQKLNQDLFPIGQMIKEATPLLNSYYLDSINIKVTKKNVKWYLDTTKERLDIIEEYISEYKKQNKKYLSDKIAYTLILRIRTIEIIKKLIKNKPYLKKDFEKLIKRIAKSNNPYKRYLAVKNNLKDEQGISIQETERLYNYLEKDLVKVKAMVAGLK